MSADIKLMNVAGECSGRAAAVNSIQFQFSFIYIVPNYNKCHLKAVQFKPIGVRYIVIIIQSNPIN